MDPDEVARLCEALSLKETKEPLAYKEVVVRETASVILPILPSTTQDKKYVSEQGLSSMLDPLKTSHGAGLRHDKASSPSILAANYVEESVIGTICMEKTGEAAHVPTLIKPSIVPVLVESTLVVDTGTIVPTKRENGYRLGRQNPSLPSSSDSSGGVAWWNFLWKLQLPSKIKLFIWKVFNGWLPTKRNLIAHRVPINPLCSRCQLSNETTMYALWSCPLLGSVRDECAQLLGVHMPPHLDDRKFVCPLGKGPTYFYLGIQSNSSKIFFSPLQSPLSHPLFSLSHAVAKRCSRSSHRRSLVYCTDFD
ncbi:hypothetical protein ACOSQ2_003029 [Xanthoceras sorbifolium]